MSMTVSATGTSTSATQSDAVSKTQVDYQSFLKLLVAQMKNQDPTNPMDSTQYMAQLAAFSQVEQSVQMNGKLDQMLQSSTLDQADAMIGRTRHLGRRHDVRRGRRGASRLPTASSPCSKAARRSRSAPGVKIS